MVTDVMAVSLDHFVVPGRRQAYGIRIFLSHSFRSAFAPEPAVGVGAIFRITVAAIEHRRMNGGDTNDVGAKVLGNLLM